MTKKIFHKILNMADEIINEINLYLNGRNPKREKIITKYFLRVPLFKGIRFRSQSEYRLLVVTPQESEKTVIKKEIKHDGHKRYIELFDDPHIILPIREIVISSSVDYESKRELIVRLLSEKEIDPETIKISKSVS